MALDSDVASSNDKLARATCWSIKSLSPQASATSDKCIEGVVSLIWPFSSYTQQAAILVAEPDFRLRKAKGQTKVRFHGESAVEVAKSGIGVGDTVRLGLEGAQFVQPDRGDIVTGQRADADLAFHHEMAMDIQRGTKFLARVEVMQPIDSTNRLIKATMTDEAGVKGRRANGIRTAWSSPAFVTSSSSALAQYMDFLDAPERSPSIRPTKRARFARKSDSWRLVDSGPWREEQHRLSKNGGSPVLEAPVSADNLVQNTDQQHDDQDIEANIVNDHQKPICPLASRSPLDSPNHFLWQGQRLMSTAVNDSETPFNIRKAEGANIEINDSQQQAPSLPNISPILSRGSDETKHDDSNKLSYSSRHGTPLTSHDELVQVDHETPPLTAEQLESTFPDPLTPIETRQIADSLISPSNPNVAELLSNSPLQHSFVGQTQPMQALDVGNNIQRLQQVEEDIGQKTATDLQHPLDEEQPNPGENNQSHSEPARNSPELTPETNTARESSSPRDATTIPLAQPVAKTLQASYEGEMAPLIMQQDQIQIHHLNLATGPLTQRLEKSDIGRAGEAEQTDKADGTIDTRGTDRAQMAEETKRSTKAAEAEKADDREFVEATGRPSDGRERAKETGRVHKPETIEDTGRAERKDKIKEIEGVREAVAPIYMGKVEDIQEMRKPKLPSISSCDGTFETIKPNVDEQTRQATSGGNESNDIPQVDYELAAAALAQSYTFQQQLRNSHAGHGDEKHMERIMEKKILQEDVRSAIPASSDANADMAHKQETVDRTSHTDLSSEQREGRHGEPKTMPRSSEVPQDIARTHLNMVPSTKFAISDDLRTQPPTTLRTKEDSLSSVGPSGRVLQARDQARSFAAEELITPKSTQTERQIGQPKAGQSPSLYSELPLTPHSAQDRLDHQVTRAIKPDRPVEIEDSGTVVKTLQDHVSGQEDNKTSDVVADPHYSPRRSSWLSKNTSLLRHDAPDVVSPYFTPRASVPEKLSLGDTATKRSTARQPSVRRNSNISVVVPPLHKILRPQIIEASVKGPKTSPSQTVQAQKPCRGLRTSLSYYGPVSSVPSHFHQNIDIIAVVTDSPSKPQRASSGPKDFYMSLKLADMSCTEALAVQIFRPRKNALPQCHRGDVLLLRDMKVQTKGNSGMRRNRSSSSSSSNNSRYPVKQSVAGMMLLSTATSAWASFPFSQQASADVDQSADMSARTLEDLPFLDATIRGPPVEYGSEEMDFVKRLSIWWLWRGNKIFPHRQVQQINGNDEPPRSEQTANIAPCEEGENESLHEHELRDGMAYGDVISPTPLHEHSHDHICEPHEISPDKTRARSGSRQEEDD